MRAKKLSAVLITLALFVGSTSIALGQDFQPPAGTNPADSDSQCIAEGGSTGFVFDGFGPQLTQFGGPDVSIIMDHWWRADAVNPVDSPEWHTYMEPGTYQNLRPDILNGTYWRFPVSTCTEDQVLQQFTNHVRAREADPSVNTLRDGDSVVLWQDTTYFVPIEDGGFTPPAGEDPVDPNGVITSGGFGDEDYSESDTSAQDNLDGSDPSDTALGTLTDELCADELADELSEQLGVDRNNRDACNPSAGVEEQCVIGYLRGPLDRLPELSSSGAGNVFTVKRQGQTFISWFPHGRATFQPGPTGRKWEAGIFCTFDQVMGWINQNMARLGASRYVDWQDLGFMNLDTYNIPGGYYGGTEDPDTAKDCRPAGEERIFEQIRKGRIDAKGFYVHGSPWVSGVSKERQIVIRPEELQKGNLFWIPSVQGAVRLYPADRCNFEEVLEQARVHHNARGKAHSALVVRNWREDPFTSNWFSIR